MARVQGVVVERAWFRCEVVGRAMGVVSGPPVSRAPDAVVTGLAHDRACIPCAVTYLAF